MDELIKGHRFGPIEFQAIVPLSLAAAALGVGLVRSVHGSGDPLLTWAITTGGVFATLYTVYRLILYP
ncbi:hypothetical protein HLRTI_000476 [Halorhabdus tiamatea SARL4B]|uniref:Uncharacterized protein n=1 Tax=Halorhabdus tiamatea SARL4B TaxID=1033806 RepID=U2FGT3_9EURY|nr:hypothetical protein HLRTI_000476 [Halorhabdus tiamatea SARL4B]